jgi:hypothetical protein
MLPWPNGQWVGDGRAATATGSSCSGGTKRQPPHAGVPPLLPSPARVGATEERTRATQRATATRRHPDLAAAARPHRRCDLASPPQSRSPPGRRRIPSAECGGGDLRRGNHCCSAPWAPLISGCSRSSPSPSSRSCSSFPRSRASPPHPHSSPASRSHPTCAGAPPPRHPSHTCSRGVRGMEGSFYACSSPCTTPGTGTCSISPPTRPSPSALSWPPPWRVPAPPCARSETSMSSAVPLRAPQWGPPALPPRSGPPPRYSGWIRSGTGSSHSAPQTIPFSLRTVRFKLLCFNFCY